MELFQVIASERVLEVVVAAFNMVCLLATLLVLGYTMYTVRADVDGR